MRYVRADLQQVNRSEWRGYVEEFHLFFAGTSKNDAEIACLEAIESTEGLSEFQVIWNRC